MRLRHLGGALALEPPGGGACGHLDERYLLGMVGFPSDLAEANAMKTKQSKIVSALGDYITGTKPYTSLAPGEDIAKSFPEPTLRRLRELKRSRDPHNVFRGNFSVLR